jgi:hypothetical protein
MVIRSPRKATRLSNSEKCFFASATLYAVLLMMTSFFDHLDHILNEPEFFCQAGVQWNLRAWRVAADVVEGLIERLFANDRRFTTHFNPVDIVCGVRNYQGEKFDLNLYANKEAVTISKKSHEGSEIKALELPGLWNGSMAFWNTVFVEVPLETFNPVKTVDDLLPRPHLPS